VEVIDIMQIEDNSITSTPSDDIVIQ